MSARGRKVREPRTFDAPPRKVGAPGPVREEDSGFDETQASEDRRRGRGNGRDAAGVCRTKDTPEKIPLAVRHVRSFLLSHRTT